MPIKESKAETALVTVAETIRSALGSLAATGDTERHSVPQRQLGDARQGKQVLPSVVR